jgi:hypothetical protein
MENTTVVISDKEKASLLETIKQIEADLEDGKVQIKKLKRLMIYFIIGFGIFISVLIFLLVLSRSSIFSKHAETARTVKKTSVIANTLSDDPAPEFTMEGTNMPLMAVLKSLQEQGMIVYVNGDAYADSAKFNKLTIHLYKRPLQEIVDTIFNHEPLLNCTIYNNNYIIRLKSS